MPEISEMCITNLPLPLESPKEEATAFVGTLVRKGQLGVDRI